MPGGSIHLLVAKKVNPNASIDFYMGNLAPDSNYDRGKKSKVHFDYTSDMEAELKNLAVNATNDYLKGFLLHLYVDWKWNTTHLADFTNKTGGKWYPLYNIEKSKMTSFAFYNTEWAYSLYEQLGKWNYAEFVETEFIKKENIAEYIARNIKWFHENNLEESSAFPQALIEKFASNTASDFIKWSNKKIIDISARIKKKQKLNEDRQQQESEVIVVQAKSMEDAFNIGLHVRENRIVIVDLTGNEFDMTRRIIDYLSGLVYHLGRGHIIKQINNGVLSITPFWYR